MDGKAGKLVDKVSEGFEGGLTNELVNGDSRQPSSHYFGDGGHG